MPLGVVVDGWAVRVVALSALVREHRRVTEPPTRRPSFGSRRSRSATASARCSATSASPSTAARRTSSPARTARARRPCFGSSSVSRRRAVARSTSRSTARGVGYVGHESLLYAELTALENLDLYGRLYRVPERRERIGHAARAVRSLGGAGAARRVVLARHDAAARALPRAAPRAGAARPRRAVLGARRGRRGAARRRARLAGAAEHDRGRDARARAARPVATGRLALGAA